MLTLGYVLIGVFAVGLLMVLHGMFWRRYYWLDHSADEIHMVQCADGARIGLYRHRGAAPWASRHPVVVCHGFMTHALFMDFGRQSLTAWLSRLGFEVWNIELRGTGRFGRPVPFSRNGWRVHFEDYVDYDAPAALRHITQVTGASQVHWVGHSMGGLLGCALAQGPVAPTLASISALGSPARIKVPSSLRALGSVLLLLFILPIVPMGLLVPLLAPFYVRLPFELLFIRQQNMSQEDMRRAASHILADVPMTLAMQVTGWADGGDVVAQQDDRNFSADLSKVKIPLLAIAGDEDGVAPPSQVKLLFDRVSSAQKRFLNLGGEGEGSRYHPYGHGDMVLGRRAPVDVFPHVARWIAQIAGVEVALEEASPLRQEQIPVRAEPVSLADAATEDLTAPPMAGYGQEPATPEAPLAASAAPQTPAETEPKGTPTESAQPQPSLTIVDDDDTLSEEPIEADTDDVDALGEGAHKEESADTVVDTLTASASPPLQVSTVDGEAEPAEPPKEGAAAVHKDVHQTQERAVSDDDDAPQVQDTDPVPPDHGVESPAGVHASDAEDVPGEQEDAAPLAAPQERATVAVLGGSKADSTPDGVVSADVDPDNASEVSAGASPIPVSVPRPPAPAPSAVQEMVALARSGELGSGASLPEGPGVTSKLRKMARRLSALEKRRQGHEHTIRREPPRGWNPRASSPQNRPRPQRLHRSPVDSGALADALRLSARRAEAHLSQDHPSRRLSNDDEDA